MSMPQHRTRHSAKFKATVALPALSDSKTLTELATEYRVHPTQITRGKQYLTKNASYRSFGKGKKKEANHEADVIWIETFDPLNFTGKNNATRIYNLFSHFHVMKPDRSEKGHISPPVKFGPFLMLTKNTSKRLPRYLSY